MSDLWLSEILKAGVRLGTPVLLATIGEIVVQRAGLVNIGIEGMMLSAALAAVLVTQATGAPLAGLALGIAAGLCLGGAFALLTVWRRGDAIVAGTGINLLALGGTGFVYQVIYGRTGSVLSVAQLAEWRLGVLDRIPGVGEALFAQPASTWLGYALVVLCWVGLSRSGLGLRLRAAGSAPRALEATGVSVEWMRTLSCLFGGACAGAGGAALVLADAGTFVEGMTAGRGFVALALVICARWSPWGGLVASLLFGVALALQFEIQARQLAIPYQFVRMLPYVATLLVLTVTAGSRMRRED